jgi:hypothetical protein
VCVACVCVCNVCVSVMSGGERARETERGRESQTERGREGEGSIPVRAVISTYKYRDGPWESDGQQRGHGMHVQGRPSTRG